MLVLENFLAKLTIANLALLAVVPLPLDRVHGALVAGGIMVDGYILLVERGKDLGEAVFEHRRDKLNQLVVFCDEPCALAPQAQSSLENSSALTLNAGINFLGLFFYKKVIILLVVLRRHIILLLSLRVARFHLLSVIVGSNLLLFRLQVVLRLIFGALLLDIAHAEEPLILVWLCLLLATLGQFDFLKDLCFD